MNIIYAAQAAQQWNGNGQQAPHYAQGAYYPQGNTTRSSDAIYSSTPRPAMQAAGTPAQAAQYAAAYQSTSRSPPTQQMYTHPPPQPQQIRQPMPQAHMQQYMSASASPPSHIMTTPHSPTQYHPQMAGYAQPMGGSMQYPASPNRPFSCDMCALSFNRQHDLKRHRETHSGEKPFLCNGGCGKTFTRKDALKRHQVSNSPTQ